MPGFTRTLLRSALALALLAPVALLPAPADARPPDREAETVAPPPMLRAAHARWTTALDAEIPAALGRLYAADAWLAPPCPLNPEGETDPARLWTRIFALPNMNVSFEPQSFAPARSGDLVVERGRGQYLHLVGGIPYGTNVSYLRVWQKRRGAWLITDEITIGKESCD